MDENHTTYTVFADWSRHVHTGTDLAEAVAKGLEAFRSDDVRAVTIFDDATGQRTDLDPHAPPAFACAWLLPAPAEKPGPGRPRLGVVSREVSLLPRHWEWLNAQRGGASAALRRLVDQARKETQAADVARLRRDAAYTFMSVVGGDLPGFEDASRALYAGRFAEAAERIAGWPHDVREHARYLLRVAAECAA